LPISYAILANVRLFYQDFFFHFNYRKDERNTFSAGASEPSKYSELPDQFVRMLRHGVTKALRRQGRLAVRRKGAFTEGLMGIGQTKATEDVSTKNEPARGSPELSDQEWRERLQPQEYQVLVGKGTHVCHCNPALP
jgi:hypothetical protein